MTRLPAAILAGLVAACGSTAPSATTSGPVAPELLAAICGAEPCGGPLASVDVYRDPGGVVAHLVRNYGDCDHPPALHFAPDGTLRDSIPLEPVEPGSPEAEAFRARVERWTTGLERTDVVRCRDGARVGP